ALPPQSWLTVLANDRLTLLACQERRDDLPETNPTGRAHEIVQAARELLEQEGIEALSMRRVAARLGIQAPSIYRHLPDKQALVNALISEGFEEVAADFAAAVENTDDRLDALGAAYRAFAHRHPHLYRLMTEGELDRANLTPGAEERAAAPLV